MTEERGGAGRREAKKKLCVSDQRNARPEENARPNYGPSSQLWGEGADWLEGGAGGDTGRIGTQQKERKRHTFPFSAINLGERRSDSECP